MSSLSIPVLLLMLLSKPYGLYAKSSPDVLSAATMTTPDVAMLTVPTISYATLTDAAQFYGSGLSRSLFHEAMTGDGIIAVSDIPSFARLRREVLISSQACSAASLSAHTSAFPDGTERTTIATTTKGLSELRTFGLQLPAAAATAHACPLDFAAKSDQFRYLVSSAATGFTQRMSELFTPASRPFLYNVDQDRHFSSFEEIVSEAEHLEHFHSYRRTTTVPDDWGADSAKSTIDLHTDQGLFIAFTPGLMVAQQPNGVSRASGGSPGSFYLQRRDGSRAVLDFGPSGDVLVFMLGDGVDMYINPYLPEGVAPLRAAPHAMIMPRHAATESRVWYGRMFLPPADALVESNGVSSGISFRQLRSLAIDEVHSNGGVGSGIGCSRHLQQTHNTTECKSNQIFCWMRCMDHTEEVNDKACTDLGLQVKCTNQRDQLYTIENGHGDFNPACTNSISPITPYPRIPPRPDACSGQSFYAFLNKERYTNSLELMKDSLYLLWSVSDGELHAKLAYNGVAGWMALGLENLDGSHGGMNGAHVVMAINDPDKDLDIANNAPYVGISVKEYIIHQNLSAFRHWVGTASSDDLTQSAMTITPCFTEATFSMAAIAGWPIDMEGENKFIWAMHNDTYFKDYHAYGARGHLTLDLSQTYGHQIHAGAASPPPDSGSNLPAFSWGHVMLLAVVAGFLPLL